MVIFTALDQTAREVALQGESVYTRRSNQVFQDLRIIFEKNGIRRWRMFGSGEARTATITSDMDVQVCVPGAIEDTMKALKKDTNLTSNIRFKRSETGNRYDKSVKYEKKHRFNTQYFRNMVVLTHRNGMTIDVILVHELGGESVENTEVIRWWAKEDLYKNTVQAIKKLFKGKN